ncbi:tetratricopeptide repeat protein [Flavobacteriaceae bacterium]|nr:tetratricopeptide repeat protein [Flavobacteriaceae bacterium]
MTDINDSIRYYTSFSPQKSLQFSFDATDNKAFYENSWESYDSNYLIGQSLFFNELYKESIEYYLKALNIYESLDDNERLNLKRSNPAWILNSIGAVYFQYNNLEKAKTYYLEALESFKLSKEIDKQEKSFGLNRVEANLALISIKLENYGEAFEFYNRILERIETNEINKAYLIYYYNQFMTLNFRINNNKEALKYLKLINQTYELKSNKISNLKSSDIYLYYSKSITDYSKYLISQNKFNEALIELLKIKKLSKPFVEQFAIVNILISECYLATNKTIDAKFVLKENSELSDLSREIKIKSFEGISNVYSQENDLKNLLSIKDSIIFNKNLLENSENDIKNIQTLIDLDDKKRELISNKKRLNSTIFSLTLALSLIIIILIIFRIYFKLQAERSKRFKLEKSQIENELSLKQRELFSKSNFILQRNDFLKSILDEISNNTNTQMVVERIKKQVSGLVNSESLYQEFDKKFVEVFPEFYKKINANYRLSKTDFRLIAYIKMNKSNNEIAQISGISIRTVQSQRYRLSKKLKLEINQDLNSFIFDI